MTKQPAETDPREESEGRSLIESAWGAPAAGR